MELNLKNFNIRKSIPRIAGSSSLPENTERYLVKAQGLIGVDIFKGDKIKIINTEGGQICEVTVFNKLGKNNQSIITQKSNGEAKFIKYLLFASAVILTSPTAVNDPNEPVEVDEPLTLPFLRVRS